VPTERLDDPYEPAADADAVRGRVMAPAIILIIVNVLNLLIGLASAGNGAYIAAQGPDELRRKTLEGLKVFAPDMRAGMENQDKQTMYYTAVAEYLGGGIVWLLLSIVALIGAIRMISLRNYGLAMTSAVLTVIPCVTPCCLLGQGAGIWALIVLMNNDVRAAFR
jgi:hypothetical protein